MALDPDDLGDANSRAESRNFRDLSERRKSDHPEMAYLPRWIPTGNWRMSLGDLIVAIIGIGILLIVTVMHLFGVIG